MQFVAARTQFVAQRRQYFSRLTVAGGLALVLSACSGGSTYRAGVDVAPDGLFRAGYADVAAIYIDQIAVPDLFVASLDGLDELDDSVQVSIANDQVSIAAAGKPASLFPAPASDDIGAWGDLTASALELLRSQSASLGRLDSETVYEAMFDGLVGKLDHFSRYSSPEEAQENRASRNGFGGIGIRIEVQSDGVHVLTVMEQTPAEAAGLSAGDIILKIDGQSVEGLDQDEVIDRLRGPIESHVRLTVQREDRATYEIDVARAHIVPQTVSLSYRGSIAVIRVSGFNQSTTRTLREKVEEAEAKLGTALDGIVLDLRGNPGGLLDQAVSVSDLFMTSGRIVSTHGRHPDSHQYFEADSSDAANHLPIVVLVNGHSASASEIVAAALQDSGRALVVGSASYGKGTVQTVLRLPNEGELTITWARFHAPSGYTLQSRGVLPDICTSGESSAESIIGRAQGNRLAYSASLRRAEIPFRDTAAIEAFRANCPASDEENELDLAVAEDLIFDPLLFARLLSGQNSSAAASN